LCRFDALIRDGQLRAQMRVFSRELIGGRRRRQGLERRRFHHGAGF
jgi:hypothetical protein